MPTITPKRPHVQRTTDKLLPKITMAVFGRPKTTFLVWLVLVIFGATSYMTLLKREGFPSISIPYTIVSGTYLVNDAAKVDAEVAKPVTDLILRQPGVSQVNTTSNNNFFSIGVQYKEGTDAQQARGQLEQTAKSTLDLPQSAQISFNAPYFGVTGGSTEKIDVAVSFYNPAQTSVAELTAKAKEAAAYLNQHKTSLVENYFVKDPFATAANPVTGQQSVVQKNFDRYGVRQDGENRFYTSVIIGVTGIKGADVIKLDNQVKQALGELAKQPQFAGYRASISASYAPSIKDEISELQRVLLEGLIAVLVVGSIVIAVRASFITVISMVTVIATVIGLLYFIGYSLNVITLFALILGLSLIVDDTIIMVEAIDASRRNNKSAREAVRVAVRKVSRAMVAATTTAALSFAPLLFVSGILGGFIRAIPVTIISALLISLVVALIFIPLFARGLILGKKQMGQEGVKEVAASFEEKVARGIARPMLWAKHSRPRLFTVGIIAVLIGFGFIGAAGAVFNKVTFNLFPPTKDTNGITVDLTFPGDVSIEKAQQITAQADQLTSEVLDGNFVKASYYGEAGTRGATLYADIISYSKRDITSQQLVKQLQQRFDNDFKVATARVGQMDVGPPSSGFTVQLVTEDRDAAFKLADDMAAYLRSAELTRPSGAKAQFTNVAVSSRSQFVRNQGKLSVNVSANFNADDTTTLVTLAQNAVKKEFNAERLKAYGLPSNVINFDIGQESDNQSSFKTLVLAFPVLLLVIYLLLCLQFKSFVQPLLIFMAIPFSLFGVTLGLYLTHNAFSFFAALGFFALIGLSIKNTILLTDFANQARSSGLGPVDAAVAALGERFRPLVATSLTAVTSLIPLAIISPFWQGLAVVLIFGLLSSTILVITVFPYYYLGGEYLRSKISRKRFFAWLLSAVVLSAVMWPLSQAKGILIAVPVSLVGAIIMAVYAKRKR